MKNKELLGSLLAALCAMSFSFEWWFVRELDKFG